MWRRAVIALLGAAVLSTAASSLAAADVGLGVRVTRTAAYNIPNTETSFPWDTEVRDDLGCWASSPNPTRLTATVAGWYLVGANITHTVLSNSDYLSGYLRVDGTTAYAYTLSFATTDNTPKTWTTETVTYLNAGQYVEVRITSHISTAVQTGERAAMWLLLVEQGGTGGEVELTDISGQALDVFQLIIFAIVVTGGFLLLMLAWIAVQGLRR